MWALVDAKLPPPIPFAPEKVATGSVKEWNLWRDSRIDMTNDFSMEGSKMLDKCREVNIHWFKTLNYPDLEVSKPFAVSWLFQEDADNNYSDGRTLYTVSCAKWETVCLLARFVLLNLGEWVAHADKAPHAERLRDAVSCSRRALMEIKEWWEEGNLKTWKMKNNSFPADIENFFDTTRMLSEMLYEFTCLSQASTAKEICAHDFNCVLLSVLEKVDVIRRDVNVPDSMVRFVGQICAAVNISVGETAWASADHLHVLKPPTTVAWPHIEMLYMKAKGSFDNAGAFFDPEKLSITNLTTQGFEDVLLLLARIRGGTFIEHEGKPMMAAPIPSIEYTFPF